MRTAKMFQYEHAAGTVDADQGQYASGAIDHDPVFDVLDPLVIALDRAVLRSRERGVNQAVRTA